MIHLNDIVDDIIGRLETWQYRRNEKQRLKQEAEEEQAKEPIRIKKVHKTILESHLNGLAEIETMIEIFKTIHKTDASDEAKDHALWKLAAYTGDKNSDYIIHEIRDIQLRVMCEIIAVKVGETETGYTAMRIMQSLPKTPLYKQRLAELETAIVEPDTIH